MSTPQLAQATAPHHYNLDYRQRPLLNVNDRQLPPPRPSSNLSNGYYANPSQRPSSNLSNRQYSQQQVARSETSYAQPQSQAREGATYTSYNDTHQSHASYDDVKRTASRASQHQREPPMSVSTQAPRGAAAAVPQTPVTAMSKDRSEGENSRKRRAKEPVDWVAYFNGKVPQEIITIHDDDSPAPQLPPPTSGTATAQHVDKRRKTDNDAAHTETTRRPYSYSNTTSSDSLNTTTAATSLASASSSSRLDATQVGQKRKRTSRAYDQETKVADQKLRPRGYLADYGNYMPPVKAYKKQRDVNVPAITERHKPQDKVDDDDGHYIIHEGTNLGDRYTLLALLGQGTFGKVVRAFDRKAQKEVAVKIIRAVPKYRDASRIELRVLQTLRTADDSNRNRCIQLIDCFDWRGHICIVTPLLGLSVFDFLKTGGFVPFPGSHIQAFAWQLLGSIAFLHDLDLIHTDLKPENILLLSHNYQTFTYNRAIPSASTGTTRSSKFRRVLLTPQINLIDFGSATFDDEYHSSVVSTRHYRAPEIILGIGWSRPIDLWSLGCILVECWTGDALFQTHDCAEHLAMMEAVTGNPIDKSLIREVAKTSKRSDRNSAAKFFKNGHLAYPLPDTPRQSRKFVKSLKRLDEIIPPTTTFNKLFLDLLKKIFVYDPKKRITAREAMSHPWFDEIVEDDGTEATKIREERERLERDRAADRRR
ncbi:hypothetical protein AMS68_001676 [Peltaster fructicola]|uniref:Protein kinase domain-containing protein n=1 Tax=Peltaster fructicola TaxID=286661 RepID=A0A6H0XNF5_9PEZI|nr:hypothetical protein AMS68_001676 [Peltaster fructicola]